MLAGEPVTFQQVFYGALFIMLIVSCLVFLCKFLADIAYELFNKKPD